jgi:uncharacterized protein
MKYTGKTLEEALASAEKDTGRSRKEFIYEVHEEKAGFFKGKHFVVEINGFKQEGKVEIKEGTVIYHKGETTPSIAPGENVIIKVNGSIISKATYINEDDLVEIEVKTNTAERKLNLDITPDKLSAYIVTEYISQKRYRVINMEPQNSLVVEAEIIEEEYPPRYQKKDIEDILHQNNVRYGIKWENLESVLSGGKTKIAEGKAVEEPVQDKIKYFFDISDEKKPVEIEGKVDYYSIGEIDFVEKDKILALIEEGTDGKPGFDVCGVVIPCTSRKKLKILSGPGCETINNGKTAKALIGGMPCLKGDRICVYPVHTVPKDVDIKTGNIHFEGDVIVKGSVKEGMKVTAGNNITVFGDVAEAVLESAGNIKIDKNLIASSITAGNQQMNEVNAVEHLKILRDIFTRMLTSYEELKKSGKLLPSVSIGSLFKVMLQSKLGQIKEKLKLGIYFFIKNQVNKDVMDLWNDSIRIYKMIEDGSFSDINALYVQNKRLIEFVNKYDVYQTPADAIIQYSQNSHIYASNNVEVRGKGCYNTNITAENKVTFTGSPGVFRGGQIFAKKEIHMKEVGSSAGVLTILKTTKEGIIEAKTAYQNTMIYFDEHIYKLENPVKMLKAFYSKGEIIVEKFKL